MAKHTPGPWRIVELAGRFDSRVNAQGIAYGRSGNRLAIVDGEGSSSAHNEANASLIAAAPDMLAALERFAKWATQNSVPEIQGIACDAFAAIAKARGDEETARLRLIRDCHDTSDVII